MHEKNQLNKQIEHNNIRFSSQIDFIRELKNAKDEESIRRLALLKEDSLYKNKKENKQY
ncbi:hypothetical protein [Petrotoga sp. 9PW.55.5.1]|uniref:hypothetical protein n=1 Tax=Petrotoga sp. 9PW.55.5.1 TaxID=1308979 RepID=UPI0013146605|nr:hypothetical protein [Petrotoga sp. 9PW.55.5.1]